MKNIKRRLLVKLQAFLSFDNNANKDYKFPLASPKAALISI